MPKFKAGDIIGNETTRRQPKMLWMIVCVHTGTYEYKPLFFDLKHRCRTW